MLRVFRMRWVQAMSVAVLAVVMLGADADARFNRIGHNLMCACSCGQVLVECNHVGCPDSDRMLGELRQQISLGGPDNGVLNWFAAKYGAIVLAAPSRGGFDRVAWITPLAVFFMATIGTAVLIKVWRARTIGKAVPTGSGRSAETAEAGALRARIRRETEF
jgi:cytochrome c-type biogenesis protein CcmH/NrfF